MMTKLMEKVKVLVEEELVEANKNNPVIFNSAHEGYGVIVEELLEARDEWDLLEDYDQYLLRTIQIDNWDTLEMQLQQARKHAMLMACELIQVAAMCDKLIRTVEENRE